VHGVSVGGGSAMVERDNKKKLDCHWIDHRTSCAPDRATMLVGWKARRRICLGERGEKKQTPGGQNKFERAD
jgi:hypothetical protein